MCHVCKSSQKWGQGLFSKTKNFARTKTIFFFTGTKTKTRHAGTKTIFYMVDFALKFFKRCCNNLLILLWILLKFNDKILFIEILLIIIAHDLLSNGGGLQNWSWRLGEC
ncbi:hypothetical protein MtrunA17_Chr4g0045731 [Medicago truncatula]|uniref:Transmembrane protein n=1 Tax=Medicago truncatula TaxID=3880 RepID=A0A396I9K2_MEDTR|nr:hypothetical protein MtrunA17_Chr4g0045731 [Medicago truncatula]